MPGRASSQAYVGRRAQLDELRQALVRVGRQHGHIVLVGGEAGIGKTRLLDEFERSVSAAPPAGRPVVVIRGTCSELAAGSLPFLPILDLLDGFAATGRAAPTIARVREDLAGSGGEGATPMGRSGTFLAFRDSIVEAATTADLVIVVDDLHWADRSTLELLAFVAPRLGDARAMLVTAYRSDELHRRHPLRPVLVELERAGSLAHLRLGPLAAEDVIAQLEAITGAPLMPDEVARIVQLADGNPFYVEELAALDLHGARLPPSLRDLLATRLSTLSDATLEVLSGAAAIGRDVDLELLGAIVEVPAAVLRAALQEGVERHVLEATPDGRRYRFRHALLAEAVRDDLLPAERIGLHRRLAETLSARPALGAESHASATAEIAYHWTQAGDGAQAFPAWVEAGRAAAAAHAWRESAAAYEHALSLVAAGGVGLDAGRRADLGMRAAMMTSFTGDPRRAYVLAREAMAVDDGSDPVQSALRWSNLSGLANDAGDFTQERAAADRAVGLMPVDPPTRELALVLVEHVGSLMLHSDNRASVEEAEEARRVCRLVGAGDIELVLDANRAQSLAGLGRADGALAAADSIVAGIGSVDGALTWQVGTMLINELAALVLAGQFEVALTYNDRVAQYVSDLEIEQAWRQWFGVLAAYADFYLGRWSEATEQLDRVAGDDLAEFMAWGMWIARALLDGATSPRSSAADPAANPGDVLEPQMRAEYGSALALASLWAGDARTAVNRADDAVAAVEDTENVATTAWAVSVAIRAWADMADAARATRHTVDLDGALRRVGELAGMAASIAAGTWLDGASATPWMLALCAASEAEGDRAAGRPDAAAWHRAAAAHDALGTRPFAAYARFREGEAALASGDRVGAAAALGEAANVAAQLGAAPLARMVEDLARRARIRLDAHAAGVDGNAFPRASGPMDAATPDPWGLSDREREVLALVADGRTNREIGETLFISDKTASVHVTHILAKLGVSSRTEAALLAARAGFVTTTAGEGSR